MTAKNNISDFFKYVHKTETCWLWTGAKDGKKYGFFSFRGRQYKSHRFSYSLAYGKNPGKLHVLHKCDNPSCVRPDHLFLGTNQDNVDDKMKKRRHWTFKKTHCSNGHELTEENTRIRKIDGSRCCRTCERERCKSYYYKAGKARRAERAKTRYSDNK